MEFVGLLAPIAFVFAIGSYSLAAKLKKDVELLKEEIEKLKAQ